MKYYTHYNRIQIDTGRTTTHAFGQSSAHCYRVTEDEARQWFKFWTNRMHCYSLAGDEEQGVVIFLPGMDDRGWTIG